MTQSRTGSALGSWAALRAQVASVLEPRGEAHLAARVVNGALLALIAANLIAMIAESVPSVGDGHGELFRQFEVVSLWIFAVEYVLRLWSCTALPGHKRPIRGRLRFAVTPVALIDLLAILPLLPVVGGDFRSVRAFRLFRVFRIAKMARYSGSLRLFGRVFREHAAELLTILLFLAALLVITSSMMYYAENEAQPEAFSSIPAAIWWSIATLTTVGYGDIVPVTELGKLLASAVAVLGIGMFALPTSILGAAFVKEISRTQHSCPHCGREIQK
jgi:voltage-gated potassium channel